MDQTYSNSSQDKIKKFSFVTYLPYCLYSTNNVLTRSNIQIKRHKVHLIKSVKSTHTKISVKELESQNKTKIKKQTQSLGRTGSTIHLLYENKNKGSEHRTIRDRFHQIKIYFKEFYEIEGYHLNLHSVGMTKVTQFNTENLKD